MEHIKEANKNLISLRTSIITVMIVLTSGTVGLLFINIALPQFIILLCFGIYFDLLFLHNVICINKEIENNIGRLKNDSR